MPFLGRRREGKLKGHSPRGMGKEGGFDVASLGRGGGKEEGNPASITPPEE